MATITISDLRPAGSELFLDSESYLNNLTDSEMEELLGGGWYLKGSINRNGVWVQFSWAWR